MEKIDFLFLWRVMLKFPRPINKKLIYAYPLEVAQHIECGINHGRNFQNLWMRLSTSVCLYLIAKSRSRQILLDIPHVKLFKVYDQKMITSELFGWMLNNYLRGSGINYSMILNFISRCMLLEKYNIFNHLYYIRSQDPNLSSIINNYIWERIGNKAGYHPAWLSSKILEYLIISGLQFKLLLKSLGNLVFMQYSKHCEYVHKYALMYKLDEEHLKYLYTWYSHNLYKYHHLFPLHMQYDWLCRYLESYCGGVILSEDVDYAVNLIYRAVKSPEVMEILLIMPAIKVNHNRDRDISKYELRVRRAWERVFQLIAEYKI